MEEQRAANTPEPWLRGTHGTLPPVPRAVLHALELAREDVERWCARLSEEEMHAGPYGLAPVAFHLRHIARSLDRFATYAEGEALSPAQQEELASELAPRGGSTEIFAEFEAGLARATERLRRWASSPLERPLVIGRKKRPTTFGALLVHMADHTQRHTGQAIATAKVVRSLRSRQAS